MKYFRVTLMQKGQKSFETIKAANRIEAIKIAKQKFSNSVVLKAEETSPPIDETIKELFGNLRKSAKSKVPVQAKISSIRQIAVMTDAGIAINTTLEEVAQSTDNKTLKEILTKVCNDINAGNSLSDAVSAHVDQFGHVGLAMTKLGERTGNISQSYHKLADILENIRNNTSKFKKAIRMPMITLIAMGAAFTILIMVVVPKFKDMFEKFGSELPIATQVLLKIEWALNNYGLLILLLLIGIVMGVKFLYANNDDFRYRMDQLLIHPRFYLINKAIYLSTMYKYNLIFGELVRAGIPVSEALETAVGMVENEAIKEQLLLVNANIGRGMSLAEALELTGLYENMLLQMIKAGEQSGQLDVMIEKVTEYYNMQFQELIDNLSAYIEPILLVFLAAMVLLMALGIFMPMWDLGKAVKG